MSSVQVAVRARPLSQREKDSGTNFCIEMKEKSTVLYKSGRRSDKSGGMAKEFVFDHSYWSVIKDDDHFVEQEKVFDDLGIPVLDSAFQGYNVCVFAYGQTGSGKTHTMMGSEGAFGLIPRICEGLFSWMSREKTESGEQVSYKNNVSYMEIYNEKVRDLLILNSERSQQIHSLRVREHPKEGPYVEDLSRHAVEDYSGISDLLELGNSRRVTASTRMNSASSRSHAIFTLKFTQAKYSCGLPSETVSKIHLVDLAGSERASSTGAEGERLKEGASINRSLVCLGTVISALADAANQNRKGGGGGGVKKGFIPYRDSVLTWLLKDSLGGNAKTIMIATISPAESSYGETLSTLRYASRAKNIINKPTVNEDQNVKLIRDLRAEIQCLKSIIVTSGTVDPLPDDRQLIQRSASISLAEDIHKKEEQVAELTRKWAGKWTDIRRIVEEHHLALRSEGVKMVVDSIQPHFVGVDPDILSTGLVFYYLKDGSTTIGAKSDSYSPDINVIGGDIDEEHCRVESKGHDVVLHPLGGDCFVNHNEIKTPYRMSQGDLLQLGESSVLRFNHPHEAQKLRQKYNEGLLSRDTPSPVSKAHTLPRRKKRRVVTPESNSSYLIDQRGSPSPSPSSSSCTMTVELESQSMVIARRKKRGQSSLSMTPNRGSFESEVELSYSLSPCGSHTSSLVTSSSGSRPNSDLYSSYYEQDPPLSSSMNLSSHSRKSESTVSTSPLSSLLVWLTAPFMLCVVAIFTSPIFVFLGCLLLFMRILGLSNRCFLVRWIAVPLSLCTSLMLSPLAFISELLFRRTLNFLTFIHVKDQSVTHISNNHS